MMKFVLSAWLVLPPQLRCIVELPGWRQWHTWSKANQMLTRLWFFLFLAHFHCWPYKKPYSIFYWNWLQWRPKMSNTSKDQKDLSDCFVKMVSGQDVPRSVRSNPWWKLHFKKQGYCMGIACNSMPVCLMLDCPIFMTYSVYIMNCTAVNPQMQLVEI